MRSRSGNIAHLGGTGASGRTDCRDMWFTNDVPKGDVRYHLRMDSNVDMARPSDSPEYQEFTEQSYCSILDLTRERYKFEPFGTERSDAHVIWRHDVDMSVQRALFMARCEAERGVAASYFFRLHGDWYSLFERATLQVVSEILALGHVLGLHFEEDFHGRLEDDAAFERTLTQDAEILEGLTGQLVRAFSFHNPDTYDSLRFMKPAYCGLHNAYATNQTVGYRYVSDSNGYWRFTALREVLADPSSVKLHILTHPEWWTPEAMAPRSRVQRCAEGRAARAMENYDTALAKAGRRNIR